MSSLLLSTLLLVRDENSRALAEARNKHRAAFIGCEKWVADALEVASLVLDAVCRVFSQMQKQYTYDMYEQTLVHYIRCECCGYGLPCVVHAHVVPRSTVLARTRIVEQGWSL